MEENKPLWLMFEVTVMEEVVTFRKSIATTRVAPC